MSPLFSSHFVSQIIGRIIEFCGPTYNICFILDNTISKIIFAFIFWDFIFWYMTWDNSISTKLFSWKKMWWANIVCGLQICLVWCTNMSLWWTRRIRQKYIRMDIWKIKLVQRIFVVTPYTAHIQCTIFLVFNSWMTFV